ncbi:hypothetical protein GCK72_024738 [Caenorhabditis remanei]|uniref:Uncharacterized protein n=1 Tax=Caenorhabditis remanei TaxID=31234 RepID=A0A6A5G0K4_CAERE|nr:hypothetical protein GCK72_024738 [Caenorhabditis remanei]KAF1748271.1 hypothetical protein GCK72_024738 [Caenorhabditis remanei]
MDLQDAGDSNNSDPLNNFSSSANVKLGATLNQGEDIPPANSPATSISSIISEQSEAFRNSPFLSQSPLSSSAMFQRPDISGENERPMSYPSMSSFSTNVPDSECSSRSSVDGYNLKDSTSENIKLFRQRHKAPSSESSSDEDADINETEAVRKISSKSSEEKFVPRGIDAPRGRIANIRRESSCSVDSEAAHERLVKAAQVVSNGFDDIALEAERSPGPSTDFRRRAPSFNTIIGEPISVVTNAFITNSCSPSPTRPPADIIKQCYSPSTQQMVRPNISYSPSPRPSPAQSPTRHGHQKLKFQRAESPICRTPVKRKITLSSQCESETKKMFSPRSNTSPLVTDKTFPYPTFSQMYESSSSSTEFTSFSVPHSPGDLRSLRPLTPMSNLSVSDQDDNSSSVKDAVEKIDLEDEMNEDITDDINMNEDDIKTDEDLLRAATEADLPDDDDDDSIFDFDDQSDTNSNAD